MSDDDRDLVERARRGDATAVGELFSRYWRAARAAAFGVTGEFASAEDAAADAFQDAWAGMRSLQDPERFGPWLRTIVVRKARLALARQRPHAAGEIPLDELPDSRQPADEVLERLETAALIQQAVRELPPRLREAVSLFYFEGYDSDDAARFLEIPAGTLRRRLHEGRRGLRNAVDEILSGRKPFSERRRQEIERLQRLLDRAERGDGESLYQAIRGALTLRPAPAELIATFTRRQAERAQNAEATGCRAEFEEHVREAARRFAGPGTRASDPNHPVGTIAARIRQALPGFEDWTLQVEASAVHLLTFAGEERDRLKAILPPGFADGRPGAFCRATRALIFPAEGGDVRTTYQLIQDSAERQAFHAGMTNARISDVLDLTWMVVGPLDLRSVQELLERLAAAVLPGCPIRFASYHEPRYRSALQLTLGDLSAPAAIGGVLAEWPGRPPSVDSAHVRVFLEPWATVHSGHAVEYDRLPTISRRSNS